MERSNYWISECLVLSVVLMLIGLVVLFTKKDITTEDIGRSLIFTGLFLLFVQIIVVVFLSVMERRDNGD